MLTILLSIDRSFYNAEQGVLSLGSLLLIAGLFYGYSKLKD